MLKKENNKEYENTPLWDNTLTEEERVDYLVSHMTLEEKFQSMGTGHPAIERMGVLAFGVGGEGAHGVQARHDQVWDRQLQPEFTTIFPNPIGMSATWDRDLITKAGKIVGTEARALYNSGRNGSLSLWAPTVDMERDPRWGRTEEGYGEDPYLTGEMAGAYVDGMQGNGEKIFLAAATLKHYYANNVEKGRTYISSSVDLRNKQEYYLEPFRRLIQKHHVEGLMTAYNEINGVPCMLLKEEIALAKKWGLGHVVCDGGDVGQTVDFHKYFSRHSETIAAGLEAGIDCFTDDQTMVAEAAREAYDRGMISEKDIDRALKNHFRVMLRLGLFEKGEKNPYRNIGMDQVDTEENRRIARKVTAESVILLKNQIGEQHKKILPLSLEEICAKKEKIGLIGPLGDVWYKDWYSGIASRTVTPFWGIVDGVREFQKNCGYDSQEMVSTENGLSTYYVCVDTQKEQYLGLLEDGETIGIVPKEEKEEFEVEFWGEGKTTLRLVKNKRFLTLEDDWEKGQKGEIKANKEEAFGWFVKEIFYFVPKEKQQHLVLEGELLNWNEKPLPLLKGRSIRMELCKDGLEKARESARKADKVVLFLGSHPMITCKEEIDRQGLELPWYQQELLQQVYEENANVVLVLVSSVPYEISWAKEHIPAIMVTATGSMELGNGIADILFGKESPAGRLNMTWYEKEEDLPSIHQYDIIQGERTYAYYTGNVLYPFGHGETYTQFQYDSLSVKKGENKLLVEAVVTNAGEVTSDEVVQIYVRKNHGEVKRPLKQLKGFERIKQVKPGETRSLSVEIPLEDLTYYDVISKSFLLEEGEYEIMAGASSADIRQSVVISLEGQKRTSRDGFQKGEAECFDRARGHVLHKGHLGYTAVCTRNDREVISLEYDKMYLCREPKEILLDFWQEHPCVITIKADGKVCGQYHLDSPSKSVIQVEAGQANGDGAFEAHQNWITRHREIGFTQVAIPVKGIPVGKECTLEITWQGMGKICTYVFQ